MLSTGDRMSWDRDPVASALPPPPEVAVQNAIPWRLPADRPVRHQLPRHPLLCLADPMDELPEPRAKGLSPAALLRRVTGPLARSQSAAEISRTRGSGPVLTGRKVSSRPPERPLVVVVAGGKGGSGASFLALDIGWVAADPGLAEPLRVLLVDANRLNFDLDLRLGVAEPERDQLPSARVDQLLLRLPELAERRVRLQSLLWSHSIRPLSALLGPAFAAPDSAVGPEHLDYLFRYLLAPAFDLIVVDAGLLGGEVGAQARFWLGQAHRLLLPMRPAGTDRRIVARSLRVVEESYGVGRERCRAVVGLERGQSSRQLALGPELDGIGIHTRPWLPQIAMMAEVRHVPMAELDRRVAASTRDLLPDLLAAEPLERSRA